MKRIFALILAILTVAMLMMSSCKVDNDDDKGGKKPAGTGELPVYGELAEGEGFYFSLFADPAQQTLEAYQNIVDCGMNWVYIDPWSGTYINSAGLIKALEMCEQVGLNALIMINNTHDGGIDEHVSFLDAATIDYTQYPAFKGVYAFDEPSLADMDWIAADYERWCNSQYKDYIYLVNMMSKADDCPNTPEFLEKYWDIVLSKNLNNILVYDLYPLYASIGDKVEPYIRENTLYVSEQFSKFAKEKGSSYYVYFQTYSSKDGQVRDMISVNDTRFQIAYNLAYGAQGFIPFTYLSMSQFANGMVSGAGTKLDYYYYVQEVFGELKNFENVYFAFDYQQTMAILGPNEGDERGYGEQDEYHIQKLTNSLESHDRIKTVETEYDLLIGTFKDDNDNDGFLITSYTDPYYMKDNNISIEFNDATRALIYYNGTLLTNDAEGTCYILEDGKLNLDLEAGDYAFVIPVN